MTAITSDSHIPGDRELAHAAATGSELGKLVLLVWRTTRINWTFATDILAAAFRKHRDLGARRQPAVVLTIGGGPVFLALCYLLHRRERILREFVLKKWAARCSEECVRDWNETVAPIVGVKAQK